MAETQNEVARAWKDESGSKWVRQQERTDAQLELLGLAVIEKLKPAARERVLDVGCGAGQTLMQLADLVGSQGSVVGVDVSAALLERARERVLAGGYRQVELVMNDAASARFEQPFDILFSRFGVMFFDDPVAAFSNLRAALRPGGRLGFVCWQAAELNPWATVPLAAARKIAPEQPPPALFEPGRAGPFYFAEAAFIRRVLEGAKFEGLAIEPREFVGRLGGALTLDEAVDFVFEIGPTARFFAEADPALSPAIRSAVREALASFVTEDGVKVPMRAWIVTASNAA
jgi:SAM-dependent methyltransferase